MNTCGLSKCGQLLFVCHWVSTCISGYKLKLGSFNFCCIAGFLRWAMLGDIVL